MALTRRIDSIEARVLGALMEKEKATPGQYPLTLNAVVSACNQKSNRDPVMSLGSGQVWDALERLRKDVLVWRSDGARTDRFEHRLANRWKLDPPAQAVMALLLLRGPQTPGELRARADRLHSFGEVAEVEATLRRLAVSPDPLVEELERQPGQRESRWRQVMGEESEAAIAVPIAVPASVPTAAQRATREVTSERLQSPSVPNPESDRTAQSAMPADSGFAERLAALEETVSRLEARLSRLEEDLL